MIAKSRVVGLNTNIPRLELQSALISIRLAEFLEKEHEFKTPRQIFRSDLKIVLHQIRKDPNQYKNLLRTA